MIPMPLYPTHGRRETSPPVTAVGAQAASRYTNLGKQHRVRQAIATSGIDQTTCGPPRGHDLISFFSFQREDAVE